MSDNHVIITDNKKKNDSMVVKEGKKWVEGTRTFKSSITHHPTRGSQLYVPHPIMERFNFPDHVIFTLQGDTVVMRKAKTE